MFVAAQDVDLFTEGPGFILSAFLVLVAITVIAAAVLGIRAAYKGRMQGLTPTTVATVLLWLVRGAAVYCVLASLAVVTYFGDWNFVQGGVDYDHHSLVVHTQSRQFESVCPIRRVAGETAGHTDLLQVGCHASNALAKAEPPNGVVAGTLIDLTVAHPSGSERRSMGSLSVLDLVAFFVMLLAVERILALTVQRKPFARGNVRWLYVLALAVAVDEIVVKVLRNRFADHLIATHSGGPGVMSNALTRLDSTDVGLSPFFVVIVILVLAEVWRNGIALRQDVEATV